MAKSVLLYSGILVVVLATADPYPNGQLSAGGVSVFAERANNRYAVDAKFRTNAVDKDYDDNDDAFDDGRATRPCCRCPSDDSATLMMGGDGADNAMDMHANGNRAGDRADSVVVVPIDAADTFDSQERRTASKMGELEKCSRSG